MAKAVSFVAHSINGDFVPTVLLQESEACQLLFRQSHHNTGGYCASVISMGRKAQLVCPLTEDPELIRDTLMRVQSDSLYPIDPPAFSTAIQVAMLSLQHRPSKSMAQAITVFVYSPLRASLEKADATRLGKLLSDESIDIKFYVLGEYADENARLLQYIVDAAATGITKVNAEITHVTGSTICDFINSYAKLFTADGEADDYLDYDYDDDPELRMAIELSRREAEEAAFRAAQEATASAQSATSADASFAKDGKQSIFGIEGEEKGAIDAVGGNGNEEEDKDDSINSDDLARDLDAMDD